MYVHPVPFSRVFSPESSSRKTARKGGEPFNGYINRIFGYRTVPECELKIQSRYLVPSDRWGFHIYNPILWRFTYCIVIVKKFYNFLWEGRYEISTDFYIFFLFCKICTEKKSNKIVLINKEFRWERFQRHTGTLYEEMLKCLVIYMRRPLVIHEESLPNIWENAEIFSHIWGPLVIYDFAAALFRLSLYMRRI